MKITTITYQAVKNRGNYESERLEMTAAVEDGEDPYEATLLLRQQVNVWLEEPLRLGGKPQEDPDDDFPEGF